MKLQLTYHFENEEELRAHLGGETRTAIVAPEPVVAPVASVAVAPTLPATTTAELEDTGARSASELDGDGMPYDVAVHSDPPSFTADGLWRSKRGKAEEAKAARAAFKAKGGAVVAPSIPSMPGMPSLPAAPTALPADAPEPITLDRVIEKIQGMITRQQLDDRTLATLYATHSGAADPSASFAIFNTNESARASLFSALCDIEPEMA